MKKLVFLALCLYCVSATAQDVVSLVVSADGPTKTQAIDNALRSAIEQTYGTFVSANTHILNDELVKDEIATVSSGNIQKYKEVAVVNLPNGNTSVTLNVTVSLKKLVKYAQSKGSECEFAGATFGANARLYEFNKRNEQLAIQNMIKQLNDLRPVYDFEIDITEPKMTQEENTCSIGYQVTVKSNDKTELFNDIIEKTLMSLAMTEKQIKPMKKAGFRYYEYRLVLDGKIGKISTGQYGCAGSELNDNKFTAYYFYTDAIKRLDTLLNIALHDFIINSDNGKQLRAIKGEQRSIYLRINNGNVLGHQCSPKAITFSGRKCTWDFEDREPCWPHHSSVFFVLNRGKIVWKHSRFTIYVPVDEISQISRFNIIPYVYFKEK